MPSKKLWAIVGKSGLYTGTWQRRIDAIAGHTHDVGYPEDPEVSCWPFGSKLSPQHKQIWRRCQRNGDRAVKVIVTWE